jgi:WD40 repeat protein
VILWDVASGALRERVTGESGSSWWVGFADGGGVLAVASDAGVDLYDPATLARKAHVPQESGQVTRAAVSADGKRLATASSDGHVRIFDLADADLVRDIPVIDDVIWSVAFSPDGRLFATAGSDEVVTLWNLASGAPVASFAGHNGGAMDLAFLADDATLAVVDRSGQLHLWDVVGERRLAPPIQAHEAASWRLAVEPGGNRFVTTGDDGRVLLWDALSAESACGIGFPALDRERRREYFGDESHPLFCAALLH